MLRIIDAFSVVGPAVGPFTFATSTPLRAGDRIVLAGASTATFGVSSPPTGVDPAYHETSAGLGEMIRVYFLAVDGYGDGAEEITVTAAAALLRLDVWVIRGARWSASEDVNVEVDASSMFNPVTDDLINGQTCIPVAPTGNGAIAFTAQYECFVIHAGYAACGDERCCGGAEVETSTDLPGFTRLLDAPASFDAAYGYGLMQRGDARAFTADAVSCVECGANGVLLALYGEPTLAPPWMGRDCVLHGNIITDCTAQGVLLTDMLETEVTANVIRGSGAEGCGVRYGEGMRIAGNRIVGSAGGGIDVLAAAHVEIDGNALDGNSRGAVGTHSGVRLRGNTRDVLLSGNRFQAVLSGAEHDYLVALETGCEAAAVVGNDLRGGYVTDAVLDEGAGTVLFGNLPVQG